MMLFDLFRSTKTTKDLSPAAANENMKADSSIVLLDVREEYEYKNGHIKGAKLLPVGRIEEDIEKMKVDKHKKVYVYCQSGARSARACSLLEKIGYTEVYNLGGIISWPYEIIR